MFKRIHIITVAVTALFSQVAPADVHEDLKKLRDTFESDIAAANDSQLWEYLNQLKKIEDYLAAEKRYADAIKVRDEAKAIESLITGRNAAPKKHVFLASSATTIGITWDPETETLRGWRSPEDAARWQLTDLVPGGLVAGGYEVFLEFQAGASEGGRFVISEAFFQLRGQIESTGGDLVKRNVGTLRIRSGKEHLSLSATEIELGGLMRLKSIELVPAWQ